MQPNSVFISLQHIYVRNISGRCIYSISLSLTTAHLNEWEKQTHFWTFAAASHPGGAVSAEQDDVLLFFYCLW